MKARLKSASISKTVSHQNPYLPHSIKRIEERPDLNDYVKGKPVTIRFIFYSPFTISLIISELSLLFSSNPLPNI